MVLRRPSLGLAIERPWFGYFLFFGHGRSPSQNMMHVYPSLTLGDCFGKLEVYQPKKRENIMKRVSNRQAIAQISVLEDFTNSRGSFRGKAHTPGNRPDASYSWENDLAGIDQADFIVWSYNTPIGWHLPGLGWDILDRTFSSTTSRHQHALRMGAQGDRIYS